jgi:pilus assembly protein Flp/PilA
MAKRGRKGGIAGTLREGRCMFRKLTRIKRFLAEKEGVTLIEYCLIAALIAIVSLIILSAVGTEVSAVFSKINSALSSAGS